MTARRTLMDDVLDDMAAHAASGEPYTDWTCGKCDLDGAGVVRAYVYEVELAPARGKRKAVIDYRQILVCPCCSGPACPHDFPFHGEPRLKGVA